MSERPRGVESEMTWTTPGGALELSHLSEIVETLCGLTAQSLPGSGITRLSYDGEHLVIRLREPRTGAV